MNMETAKLAAIGDKDTVLAFRALGIETFYATEAHEIKKTIIELDTGDYTIIFITNECAAKVTEFLASFDEKPYPIILSIPDGQGGENFSIQRIIKNMERAVGSAAALR